ncbi:hypothetical protein Y032_0423g1207 [Ancylostoma ceylanicum]|uniref:Protein quiver n=1 Tax=Ancylostoma ceylanicum TaxID=53326 RepID=A0A016X2X3_9BILA|nr:hypothetical protein Y032_0423g1207 [Ancylostoma ceylanicum]
MHICTILFVAVFGYVETLRCHQCNGWHGAYPLQNTAISTCDNLNNQCQASFCVKITDPMTPGVPYTTYKADCWTQSQLQVTPGNSVQVENRKCYDYQDNSVPSKRLLYMRISSRRIDFGAYPRWKYCFCNNEDYCNASGKWDIFITTLLPILASLLL